MFELAQKLQDSYKEITEIVFPGKFVQISVYDKFPEELKDYIYEIERFLNAPIIVDSS